MAIPAFNSHGLLPEGVHDATIEEIRTRFGIFQRTDRRPNLWNRLMQSLGQVKACNLIEEILMDGSFVTEVAEPNDIDLVIAVAQGHDFAEELPMSHYNVLAQNRVRSKFGFDIVVVRNGTQSMKEASEFFQQV